MIFKSSVGLIKSRCDIPNGITQEWICPFSHKLNCSFPNFFYRQLSFIKGICLGAFFALAYSHPSGYLLFRLGIGWEPKVKILTNSIFQG